MIGSSIAGPDQVVTEAGTKIAPEAPSPVQRSQDGHFKKLHGSYTAPQRLKRKHKELIKEIKSLEQGFDGTKAQCIFCNGSKSTNQLEIHHNTHIIYKNELEQLDLACKPCNIREDKQWRSHIRKQSDPLKREGENNTVNTRFLRFAVTEHATNKQEMSRLRSMSYGSKEGQKHEVMRPAFCKWIRDVENGPFSKTQSWSKQSLAEAAPYGCSLEADVPFGSSITYMRYINEDVAGAILIEQRHGNNLFVCLNREKLEQNTTLA